MGNIYSRIKNENKNRIYPIGNNGMLSNVLWEKIKTNKERINTLVLFVKIKRIYTTSTS